MNASPALLLELEMWLADHAMGLDPAAALNFHPVRNPSDWRRLLERMANKYLCAIKMVSPDPVETDDAHRWRVTFTYTGANGFTVFDGAGQSNDLFAATCWAAKAAVMELNEVKRTLP